MAAGASEIAAAARLDLMDALRSRWVAFNLAIYVLLAALFVFVAMRESTVLGFTGASRVLVSFCHALILLIPLLALLATGQSVNRAREDGTLELLFGHPLSPSGYFIAVTFVRYALILAPLVAVMLGMPLYARVMFGDAVPWRFIGRTIAVCASLSWCFVAVGLAVSTLVTNQARATTYVLLVWAASVALLDFALIGLMLAWRLNPQAVFLLASVNPVQAARMALLSGADPELSVLGPVGFYLAGRVGSPALFALGVAWPAAAGLAMWFVGFRSFTRGDYV